MALGRTVRETQLTVDSREFCDWIAYRQINPWGLERGDMRAAQICLTLVNMWSSKGITRPSLSDYMLKFEKGEKPKAQSEQTIEKTLRLAANLHNERLKSDGIGR